MTHEEIIDKAQTVLSEEFETEREAMKDEAALYDTLQLDSIARVDFIAVIDFTFKVRIPVEILPEIKTFAQLYDYLESHIN